MHSWSAFLNPLTVSRSWPAPWIRSKQAAAMPWEAAACCTLPTPLKTSRTSRSRELASQEASLRTSATVSPKTATPELQATSQIRGIPKAGNAWTPGHRECETQETKGLPGDGRSGPSALCHFAYDCLHPWQAQCILSVGNGRGQCVWRKSCNKWQEESSILVCQFCKGAWAPVSSLQPVGVRLGCGGRHPATTGDN